MVDEEDFVNEGFSEEELSQIEDMESGDNAPVDDLELDAVGDNEEALNAEATENTPQEPPKNEGDGQDKTVPLSALQEARSEAREMRQQMARLQERTDILLQQQTQPQAKEEPQAPNPDEDPLGHMQFLLNQQQEQNAASQRQLEQFQATQAQQMEFQQRHNQNVAIVNEVDAIFTEKAQSDPELVQIAEWFSQQVHNQAMQQAQGDLGLANAYFYQILADQATQAKNAPDGVDGYMKRVAAFMQFQPTPTAPQPDPAQRVLDLQSKADRHTSLSSANGGEAPAQITAQELARMSDQEFTSWMAQKGNAAKFDRIMGG